MTLVQGWGNIWIITLMAVWLLSTVSCRDLQILWLFPKQNMEEFTLASSMGPFALSVETVQNKGLLGDMGVNITWRDSACDPKAALGHFVTYLLQQRPDAVFGPPCTRAMNPVADLAAFQNIPIFSWVSNMHDLDNKTIKSTLVRAIAPLSSLGELLIFFCAQMNWSRVSMISTLGESPEGMASFFRQAFKDKDKFSMVREFNVIENMASRHDIEQMYDTIKHEARIIILVIPKTEVRRYLVIAHDLGMTNGDFQFLYTERTVSDKAFLDEFTSRSFWQLGDADDEKARRGYHNLLYFTYHYLTEWSLDSEESTQAALRVFGSDKMLPRPTSPDKFSRFLYDAFYLYALAFNDTMERNQTPDGAHIFEASKNKHFQGQTGRFLSNDQADRQSSFLIWDMDKNDIFQQVVITRYTLEGELTCDVMAPILWGNGRMYNTSDGIYIPPDVPVCGFENEYCVNDSLSEKVAPSVVVLIMLVGFIAVLLIYRWWKNERMLYETLWKIKYTDLNFNIVRGPLSQMCISGLTGSQKSLNDCDDNRSESSTGNMSSNNSTFKHDNMVMISQMFTTVAKVNGDLVAVRKVHKKSIKEDKFLLKEMKQMKSLKHTNLASFHGACTEAPNICVLWEYCSKGSLEDILHNTDIKLEAMFQFSIALDICTGLNYLHSSELEVHGRLKTTNCVIDSRWVAKLTDFGLKRFKKGERSSEEIGEDKYYTDLFWTAPELLRPILQNDKVHPTKEADLYSLGVVLKQLLCKNLAYNEELAHQTPKDIIIKVANPGPGPLVRPHITEEFPEHHIVMMSFVHLIKACWAEDPSQRPTIKKVLRKMKRMSPLKSSGVLDNMLSLMERYSNRLEDLVSERTLQLEEEKRKTDTLLYRMLPRKVADDLKIGHHVQAEAFTDVTIYFSDIVGFTTLASESTPMEVVEMLNLLYSQFDDIIQMFNVYKVETIGDAYMVVCGCPDPNPDHAATMADMALTLLDSVIHFTIPHRPDAELRIRIGLNSGPVVAGVVGNTMPRYCLFGNTVNLASRMESQGLPQKIQVSFFTHEILKTNPDFIMEARGLVEVKGKGKMPTYWLLGRKSSQVGNQENKVNSKSSSPAISNEREVDGGDGDVTRQRTVRPTDCVVGNPEMPDNNSGVTDSASYSRREAEVSPKKSCRQASASSMSNTSCMSFENTQNTLTSMTDIEEVCTDQGFKKHSAAEAATGPNLEQCLTIVKVDSLDATDRDTNEQEMFWTDHFKNRIDSSVLDHSDSTLHENNFSNEDHHESKPRLEKDNFGMNHFGNGGQNKDVALSDFVAKNNSGGVRYENGSLDRVESIENEISMNILLPSDDPSKNFLEDIDNQRLWGNENRRHLFHLEGHQKNDAFQDSTKGSSAGACTSIISCNNLGRVKFPINQQLQPNINSNNDRFSQQTSLDSLINLDSPTEQVSHSFPEAPGYPRSMTNYDDNSTEELETDAFIANTSTDQENGGLGYNMCHHRDIVKYSSTLDSTTDSPVHLGQAHASKTGNLHGTMGNDIGHSEDVSQDTEYYHAMSLDSKNNEVYEQIQFTDKVPIQRQLHLKEQVKPDTSSQHSTSSHIPNLPLATKSSEKLLTNPTNKDSMMTDSPWTDKISVGRNIQAYAGNKPTYSQIQLSCVESWEHSPEVKTTTLNFSDDQHQNIVDI